MSTYSYKEEVADLKDKVFRWLWYAWILYTAHELCFVFLLQLKAKCEELQKKRNQRYSGNLRFVAATMSLGTLVLAIAVNFFWIRFYSPETQPESSTAIISQQFINVLDKYGPGAVIPYRELQKDLEYMRSEANKLKINLTVLEFKRKECETNHKICLDNLTNCELKKNEWYWTW